jgi:hypothetical protein
MKSTLVACKFFMVIVLAIVLLPACTYKNKQSILNASTCNTASITYSNFVSGYLSNNGCVGCHSGGQSPNLSGFNEVKTAAMQANFIGCIKHLSPYSPMPKNQAKTDACTIAKLEAWISAGMPN